MRSILLFLFALLSLASNSKKLPVDVYIIYNDVSITKEEIKSQIDRFYAPNKKLRGEVFQVRHLSLNGQPSAETWDNYSKKRVIDYSLERVDCDVDLCEELNTQIEYVIRDRNVVFYHDDELNCTFSSLTNNNIIKLPSSSLIGNEIEKQFANADKSGLALIFYITNKNSIQQLEVELDKVSYEVEQGDDIVISPIITGDYDMIQWDPKDYFLCNEDCSEVTIEGSKNTEFSVIVTNQSGCTSRATSKLIVLEPCIDMSAAEIPFEDLEAREGKKYRKYGLTVKGVYVGHEMISRSAGDRIFDLFLEKNCADSFRIRLLLDGEVKYEQREKRPEIEHARYPEYFHFGLDLRSLSDDDIYKFYTIEVESYDDDGNTFETYRSERVLFTLCQ